MHVPRELVEACKRGDPGAFEDLVRATHRPVYSLVYRIVGNPDDAADVTQEVYIRVWRGLRGFRGDADAGTWLHRIAANAALTYLKRRARGGTPTEPERFPEPESRDDAETRADADLLDQALRRLPEQHRTAVVLKDVYGWSCEEIAKRMGTTEGAIKVRLFRARQRLADELAAAGVVVPITKKNRKAAP